MKSSAMLDSAVFQLTPTRTRFDLVITVNGKKEKIASGLFDPFLCHLKAAQDQMAKGGYSIVLVPEHGSNATWFTRGTIERFVRFVSTPEILERVYTIESEILQIEEAIAIQGNSSTGISIVEANQNYQIKQVESTEGTFGRTSRKTKQDNVEKAVVPYKPPEANGISSSQAKSKGQLLQVLETRKSMLHKEQGMAFARAVAAGFDIDYIPALMSFAECFEASRLMDACRNFMSLWKRKHESGLWLEIEASEATWTPNHADFSAINGSGIVLSNNMVNTSHTEMDSESNGGKTNSGNQNNIQGQFPHNGFSSWPVHSPPGALPVFHPYAAEGIPYYPTYPGNGPFMQPGCPPMEDPRLHADQSMRHRRHSMDNRHNNTESENWVIETSKTRFQDEIDVEREGLQTGDRRKKVSRSDRCKSGNVVIRNIEYITKTKHSSGTDSDSATEPDEDKEIQESVKPSKRRGSGKASLKRLNSTDKKETDYGKEADGGHWQAFQTYLLKGVEEDRHAVNQDKFEVGKVDHVRIKKHVAANDPLNFTGNSHPSSDAAAVNGQGYSNTNLERKLFRNANDDSFMIEHIVDGRNVNGNAIDMDTEFPKVHKKEGKAKISNYQPDEMSLMPERGADKGSTRYDCALDYKMQAQAVGKKKGALAHNTKPGSKMLDKVQKSKPTLSSSDRKKTVGPIRRGKTNKPSPLDEARARAERLRNYKADLQKMKKEKEEEDIRRLEALKKERQKRIAARSSSVTKLTTKSTMPSQQTKRQFQTNSLPTVHKGSKFSDSEPRSSLPFQRFPIRAASGGSNDSSKASKTGRPNTGSSNSVTSKLRRSVPLLPERKKEKGDGANNTKASITKSRRFSEPKMSSIRPNSLAKPRSSRTISRTKAVDETEKKKISAIVNYDKDKIATLPELKIRISKEKTQKLNGDKPSMNSEGALLKTSETGISSTVDGDENPIIDKTVAMVECEKKPSSLDINDEKSRGKPVIAKGQDEKDKAMEKTKTVPPSSSLRTNMVHISLENQSQVKHVSSKVKMNNTKNEPSNSSSTFVAEETYRAPYSRGSSLEDRRTQNSEHGKAPPTSLDTAFGTETFRAHVSDTRNSTLEKIPEVNENPQAKESPKGLRRLLKFGKKNHNSDTGSNMESDNARIEIGANSSSNEAPLKNLLSRDETISTNATPQKSTRTFSLLSPFRSNSREKKIMTA
ncbi:COP1-interacting protein 7-like isoform X2 [Trifolium pratense]|uniref:COP1-interacting protein 7-like isoform X2 n=1 Tax=Trifolium pratense TaxID=57577 RepID=UPI001E69790C|nr:COP1-interacting protein 7-like isoform X2 [Trifolium pratense]